jgi:hypothetical protein
MVEGGTHPEPLALDGMSARLYHEQLLAPPARGQSGSREGKIRSDTMTAEPGRWSPDPKAGERSE